MKSQDLLPPRALFCAASLAGFVGLGALQTAEATLIAYEPFDYTAGVGLNGLNGGTGFAGAWRDGSTAGGSIVAGSLSVGGVPTLGNKAVLSGTSGTLTIFRDFAEIGTTDGTTTWISFLAQRTGEAQDPATTSPPNMYPRGVNVSFFDSQGTVDGSGNPDERFGLGNSSNATVDAWSIFFEGGSDRQESSTPWSQLAWGVMRIDHNGDATVADDMYLWINPDPGVEPLIGDAAASLVGAYDLSNVDSVRPFIGNESSGRPAGELTLDELRIGTTYADMSAVPEPSVALLGGLGLLGLMRRRRR